MNTKKHKNKKVNRQANLSNPQKGDAEVSDSLINSQILDLESERKGESVQDKTDNVLKELKEHQEIDVIAPKKPKRKKGKKKEMKGEECENEEDKLSKITEVESIAITDTEKSHADLPEVIPVRKKKNKKKGSEIKAEKMPIEEHELNSVQLQEEVQTECKTNKNLPYIETVDEVKIAKKTNKKRKNRTDSEKSDKSVEIISCTSAFQQLLDTEGDDRSQVDIREPDIELVSNENKITFDKSPVDLEAKSDEILQKLEELKPTSITEVDSLIKENKKSESFECKSDGSQKPFTEETLNKVLVIEDTNIVENPETLISNEDTLKCKAKIAKPVNKKRKEKQEPALQIPIEDASVHESVSQPPCVGESFKKVGLENLIVEKIEADNTTMTEIKDFKEPEHSVIAPQASSRTRKTKGNEKTILKEDVQKLNIEVDQEVAKNELLFETLVPSDFASKSSEDKVNEILSTITEPIINTENSNVIKMDSKQLLEKTEKARKKGKKAPKILINPETSTTTEESENIKTDDNYSILTPIDEIEIRSVKADESEGSACDVTPEILHPRSTSEHIRDNNNNTVIQEIFEDTLNIPVMSPNVPLIQGSGETPTETSEAISLGIKSIEIESIAANVEDKTDIRSKMMEVNKDMEELKSSIEKSLAELNALEKKEEISEKQFEEKHELNINNKKPVESDDMMVRSIISEETSLKTRDVAHEEYTDVVTVVKHSNTISQEGVRTTDYHGTEKILAKGDQLKLIDTTQIDTIVDETKLDDQLKQYNTDTTPPICPARRDNKKGKKRKGRQEVSQTTNTNQSSSSQTSTQDAKDKEKSEQNTETAKQTDKQQSNTNERGHAVAEDDHQSNMKPITSDDVDYEPIENFEDALTSSADDINQTFEMIVNQMTEDSQQDLAIHKPEINIIAPVEDSEEQDAKENPVTPPKNLLGHPNIPVRSNKTDYKKEKDKSPDTEEAKVKIKDSVEIENNKESKQSQTEKKREDKQKKQLKDEEYFCQISNCDDYMYKYSFRRVFLQSTCHICKKELSRFRIPCKFCSLVFYCSIKHKDEDWPKHQALCFSLSTIVHIKGQKHIYADAKNITGHNYRLLRMQAILACEKVLKRRLVPWEQEVLLYPRMCADVSCREWRQSKLKDCEGCGQVSYCSAKVEHLPKTHQRWCKSYLLYQKLVIYQQTKGRLEPKLPSRVLKERQMPEKINEVLASMFEEKIDLNDIQYAALTQIATAPLTVAFSHQIYRSKLKYSSTDTNKMSPFVIHVVGAELQFEADVLNKWEIFFLHVRPDVKELSVVLISPDLNPGKLPLDLLGRIRVCEICRQSKRRVVFSFQDKKTYQEYRNSNDFIYPDIVCAFNPSLHRSSVYNGKDPWPSTINAVMTLKSPFLITSHTISELHRDLDRVKEFKELEVLVDPRPNPFSSVRPDRNFISDDEVPLLFKNHCFMMLLGL